MKTVNSQFFNLTVPEMPKYASVQIEAATDCDGSLCHQPIFREDGTLNYVAPHSHLLEHDGEEVRYYAIFCDFPGTVLSSAKPHGALY